MLGAIIGDMVGSPYEHISCNIKTTDFPLFSPRSRFTDDTVMTVAVAAGLMQSCTDVANAQENIINAMHYYGAMFPNAGYGGTFIRWLLQKSRTPYGSFGNGSAMRVSPVGWMFDSIAEVEKYAEASAAVSHNHPEGIKGAQAIAGCIYLARTGSSKETIKEYISNRHAYDLSQSLDEIRENYEWDVTCQGSVPQAITAFLESTSFEDAIRKAISIGGDSDTIGAMTGSIAEAFYGEIPPAIVREAEARLDVRLLEVVRTWRAQYVNSSSQSDSEESNHEDDTATSKESSWWRKMMQRFRSC